MSTNWSASGASAGFASSRRAAISTVAVMTRAMHAADRARRRVRSQGERSTLGTGHSWSDRPISKPGSKSSSSSTAIARHERSKSAAVEQSVSRARHSEQDIRWCSRSSATTGRTPAGSEPYATSVAIVGWSTITALLSCGVALSSIWSSRCPPAGPTTCRSPKRSGRPRRSR